FFSITLRRTPRFTLFPYTTLFRSMIHIANSAAAIRFPKEMHNYIRFGISMYGLYPSKTVRDEQNIELAEAFSLHSKLIHVKKVPARTSISYGKTFTTNQP